MSHYGNDFTSKGVDQQQYKESGLADTKSFAQFQADRRTEAQDKINNLKQGGDFFKTSADGKKYLARDPNVDQAEWNKNYYASIGIENDGHDRGNGNAGRWGQEAHDLAVRAANQGQAITQEDKRIAFGNGADYADPDRQWNTNDTPHSVNGKDLQEQQEREERQRIEAKQRSQEFQAKAGALRNQFAEGRKAQQNNSFSDAENVNNSTNSARSALPEKYDVRAASQYGKVKRWDAENSNPSYSNI